MDSPPGEFKNEFLMKAFLYNPPGGKFQRGEDRCQADVEASATVTLRPPNDLGYLAAVLRSRGWEVKLRDYPARGEGEEVFRSDLEAFRPDLAVLSSTVGTLEADLQSLAAAREIVPRACLAMKGAPFTVYPPEFFSGEKYLPLDAGLMGEAEAVIGDLAAVLEAGRSPATVPGILVRSGSGMARTGPPRLVEAVDDLPYPARDLMDNRLYTLPSGRPLATIHVARGCPCSCIYCLTPVLSGRRLRTRSVGGIIGEISECVERHGIRDYFFRADTFTLDREFVISLCQGILSANLKIRWVANSRADTLDRERLELMRKAGCWLVALGLESGSDESLRRMGKGTTAARGREAVAAIRAAGLKSLSFFMIGFPWETEADILQTMDYALDLDCDFAEVHIACPYPGTELYRMAAAAGLIREGAGGNYFSRPPAGTASLSRERLLELRALFLKRLYRRPKYVLRTLLGVRNPREVLVYLRRGLGILRLKTEG